MFDSDVCIDSVLHYLIGPQIDEAWFFDYPYKEYFGGATVAQIHPMPNLTFPNPAAYGITVSISEADNRPVKIIDLIGREEKDFKITRLSDRVLLDVTSIRDGCYFISVGNYLTRILIRR